MLGGSGTGSGDDAVSADGFDREDVVARLECGSDRRVKDVEADGGVDIEVEVVEAMAVEEDMCFTGAGDVEGCGRGQRVDAKVSAEVVRGDAEVRTIPGELAVVGAEYGDIAGGPDVLLGESGVNGRGGGREVARGVERRGKLLRAWGGDGCDKEEEEREGFCRFWHGSRYVERHCQL